MYDKKYLFQSDNMFTGKAVHTWLQNPRTDLSGRTCDLDKLFVFIEAKYEDMIDDDTGFMLDIPATQVEISSQLWALIAGLVKGHADAKGDFSNVPRHNGF